MKKRFKVIIGISAFCTVAALFASLVFCGVNAFPELLDDDIQNHEVVEETVVAVNNHNNAEADNNAVIYAFAGAKKGFTPSTYDARDIVVTRPSSFKGNDKAIVEIPSVKEDIQINRGKEHLSGFYEYRDEVVIKEKANAINVTKEEDNNKILECTLLVLVIVQALGFIILQHKNKEPQIECLENRENHQD